VEGEDNRRGETSPPQSGGEGDNRKGRSG